MSKSNSDPTNVTESPAPVKRKRGRKPKPKPEVEKKVPKKRGRKPKSQKADAGKTPIPMPLHSVITKPILIKLKLGRVDTQRLDQQLNQFSQFQSNREYSPQVNIPTAFNQDSSSNQFASIRKPVAVAASGGASSAAPVANSNKCHTVDNDAFRFCDEKEKIVSLPSVFEKGIWPEATNIKCWWCTLSFDDVPCFIPKKMRNGKYHVFGCFCSFNSAMAYNLYFRGLS